MKNKIIISLVILIAVITGVTEIFELPRYVDYIGMALVGIASVLFIPILIKQIKI